MLKIENLHVSVNGKEILKGINLKIKKGEIRALLGPNASGKSTLAHTIMGIPTYKITQGKILFEGKDITKLPPEKRVKLGIALAFQNPPAIEGVKLSTLLEKISVTKIDEKELRVGYLLNRDINVGFSGGEKKLSEIVQIFSLNPKFVILDEIDSGLDIKRLEKLANLIKERLVKNSVSLLVITHRGDILRFLKPDVTNVMLKGEIICQERDWKKVWRTIKRYGYEKCKECKLPSD